MAYATVQQLVDYISEAEARALCPATGAGYDAARLGQALQDASDELDTYFASRFPTPVDPVPAVVRNAAIILARATLDRQGRDFVKSEAARIRAWAVNVSKGLATIGGGVVGTDAPATDAGAGVLIDSPARVFDDEGLADYLGGC